MIFTDYTIKEVADRANVSIATVSRILAGKAGHRADTVQLVNRIAAKMKAESQAREFGISDCIGILLVSYHDVLNTNYNSTLVSAIVESMAAENCTAQILALTVKQLDLAHIRNLVIEHNIKGLIVPEFNGPFAVSEELPSLGIPIITIGNVEPGCETNEIVCSDNVTAGRDAANYLWSLGHRSFGIVCMDRHNVCQNQRVKSFCDTIENLGGNPDEIRIREIFYQSESLTPVATELANLGDKRPTAIFSTNSLLSCKLLVELHYLGIRVPEQLSFLSFEEDRELEHIIPPVTVMSQPTRAMGELAVTRLVHAMRGLPIAHDRTLRCSLQVRKSTQPRDNTK